MSEYELVLTCKTNIILQVNTNSYSLLQQHAIDLTVNVTYTHQQELMLNINNSYIVTYNRTYTNTRYDMVQKSLLSPQSHIIISQPFGFISFDEIHVIIEITV